MCQWCHAWKMVSIFDLLAEQRIQDALARGDFEGLPGAGRPLELEEEPFVSPEQRMVNHILKNAGFVPREVLLRKEIARLRKALDGLPEGEERTRLRQQLVQLLLQLRTAAR